MSDEKAFTLSLLFFLIFVGVVDLTPLEACHERFCDWLRVYVFVYVPRNLISPTYSLDLLGQHDKCQTLLNGSSYPVYSFIHFQ